MARGYLHFRSVRWRLPTTTPGSARRTRVWRTPSTKGDAKAVAALLDDRFEWVEANGKIHTKAQVLEDLAQFAADNEGAMDVRTVDFLGQVERQLGIHHNQRFAHLWVKNAAGWQAFVYLNMPIPAERPDYTAPPGPPNEADKDLRESLQDAALQAGESRWKKGPWPPGFV